MASRSERSVARARARLNAITAREAVKRLREQKAATSDPIKRATIDVQLAEARRMLALANAELRPRRKSKSKEAGVDGFIRGLTGGGR